MTLTGPQEPSTQPSAVPPPPPAPRVSMGNPLGSLGRMNRWIIAGTALAGTVGLGAYLYLVDPNNPTNAYPKCPLKLLTGIDCPGCGGLRATHSLLHGDILGALDHNLLAFIILPVMLYALLRYVMAQFDRPLPPIPTRRFMAWAVPVFVLVFTVVRNIPVGPFPYLGSS